LSGLCAQLAGGHDEVHTDGQQHQHQTSPARATEAATQAEVVSVGEVAEEGLGPHLTAARPDAVDAVLKHFVLPPVKTPHQPLAGHAVSRD
jgi:hypothetical protein